MSEELPLNLLPTKNCYNWELIKIEPIENLINYKDHKRLMVFYNKGVTCALCGKKHGAYIGHYQQKDGQIHIDVYCEDGTMINRDHIIPKSKGGKNILDNLQPTCEPCNSKKGNGDQSRRLQIGTFVKYNNDKFNRTPHKKLFQIVELGKKSNVILIGENGSKFKQAQSKLTPFKFNIGDYVYLKRKREKGIFKVVDYDKDTNDMIIFLEDKNKNLTSYDQKECCLYNIINN